MHEHEREEKSSALLSIRAAAALCDVSPRTMWTFIAAGRLTPIRLSRRVTRLARAELERFIEQCRSRSRSLS